jgi:hypothetical protein
VPGGRRVIACRWCWSRIRVLLTTTGIQVLDSVGRCLHLLIFLWGGNNTGHRRTEIGLYHPNRSYNSLLVSDCGPHTCKALAIFPCGLVLRCKPEKGS